MKNYLPKIASVLLAAFGALTFFLSFSLIFDLFDVRHDQENFVPFVVWTNLGVSIFYLISAFGFFTLKPWTVKVLGAAVALLIITFIAYNLYLNTGGPHLEKTTGALIFRISVTLVFSIGAYFFIPKK